MKIDPKFQYKSETGETPFIDIEAKRLTEELDSVILEGMSGKEIRSLIDYDCKHNVQLGVFIELFPEEWIYGKEHLIIPSQKYIEWLESKI